MANVDELVVKIGADFDELRKELKKASEGVSGIGDDAKAAGKKSEAAFKAVKKSIIPVTAAATAAAAAVGLMAKRQLESARNTELWAQRLKMSQSEFSQLAAVGRRFGASMDDMGDSIKDLNERIADAAAGNKTYEEALNRAGLASRDLIKLPLEEQFIKVADAIGRMNNAGDQNFATAELMADAGFRLLPMFREGEKAIRGMKDQTLLTNEALSELDVKKMAEANQAILDMSLAFEGLANTITVKLTPAFKIARNFFNDARAWLRDGDELIKEAEAAQEKNQKKVADEFWGTSKKESSASEKASFVPSAPISATSPYGPENNEAGAFIPSDDVLAAGMEKYLEYEEEMAIAKQEANAILENLELQKIANIEAARLEAIMRERELEDEELRRKQSYLDRELNMEQRQQERMKWLWESGLEGKRRVTSKVLGDISGLMNSNSKKMFEVGKVAAMAQVAIDTPRAAMGAYAAMATIPIIGPALGIAAAGAAIASGVTQLQNIKSQSFGGGGGVGGNVGGGGGGSVAGPETEEVTNIFQADVTLTGDQVSSDQVRGLIGMLNEARDDGMTIGRIGIS